MRAQHFCVSTTAESRAKIWYLLNTLKPPSGFGYCLFLGSGSIVVDSLLIINPIVGFCNSSMFCCALLCVHTSFAIILMGRRELVALIFPLVSRYRCEALLHGPRVCLQFVIVVLSYHTHILIFTEAKVPMNRYPE